MNMRRFAAFVLGCWLMIAPMVAQSQSVRVTSGEHAGFSRIVLQFPQSVDWTVMRTGSGYALSVPGVRPRYGLTDVFRLIPRDRLAAIHADPATGMLQLTIGCTCHVLPFELRPGVVVLDIRDGPAPPGSSFEVTATGSEAPPLVVATPPRAGPRPRKNPSRIVTVPQPSLNAGVLNWRNDLLEAARLPIAVVTPDPGSASLDEARLQLIRQLGRGATEGVVEFTDALDRIPRAITAPQAGLDLQIRIGPEPGLDADAGRRVPGMLTAQGGGCFTDEQLDLAGWGLNGDVASSIGEVRASILGEFDQPDEAATALAIRYFLHLGFGAEARELIVHFLPDASERGLWLALAAVLDGDRTDVAPFIGMEVCDSAAALWAVLATSAPASGRKIDIAALLRSFSGLPLHLRRHVGPGLADRFREGGDLSTAGAIRDSILRAPGETAAEVRLMDVELHLAREGGEQARRLLEPLIAGSGTVAADAAVSLIHAQISAGKSVDEDLITATAAFLHEAMGGARSEPIAEALALGLASRSRLDEALSIPGLSVQSYASLWRVFAGIADRNALISASVGRSPQEIEKIPPETRLAIAAQLNGNGLFRPAHGWLEGLHTPEYRMERARAHSGLRNWRAVLVDLAGLEEEGASRRRADALAALNDPSVLDLLTRMDMPEARSAAARRLGVWSELLQEPPSGHWGNAARLLTAATPAETGGSDPAEAASTNDREQQGEPARNLAAQPLASARRIIEESRAARGTIEMLLATIP